MSICKSLAGIVYETRPARNVVALSIKAIAIPSPGQLAVVVATSLRNEVERVPIPLEEAFGPERSRLAPYTVVVVGAVEVEDHLRAAVKLVTAPLEGLSHPPGDGW
jgi:hypothetical protein